MHVSHQYFTTQLDLHPQSTFGKGYTDLSASLLSKSSCFWLCPDLLNHHPAKLTAEKEQIAERRAGINGVWGRDECWLSYGHTLFLPCKGEIKI